MNLRKLLILLILGLPFKSFAQQDTTGVRELYERMFSEVNQGDYTSIFDYMYPKFYDIVPRDVLEKATKDALNSEEVQVKVYDNSIEEITSLGEIDGISFVKISYSATMSMKFLLEGEEESNLDTKAFMLAALNKQFGSENVKYNEVDKLYVIKTNKGSLAIKDPEFGEEWKVINIEPTQKPILEQFIPESILDFFN